jgi:acyl dehydratase
MPLNLDSVGKSFGPYAVEYGDRDVILYAISIGAGYVPEDLKYVFEGADGFRAFPTFAVVPGTRALFDAVAVLDADLTKLLHGEQAVRWFAPIPTSGTLLTTWQVEGVYDKGKGALAVVKGTSTDAAGKPLFENVFSLFIRGAGGFGGSRGPEVVRAEPPSDRAPDFRVEHQTAPRQALLYRLNGDRNPLHASPEFAVASGFERPILHGLCSFGFGVRAFVDAALDRDCSRLKEVSARFTGVVFPGDTLVTEGWRIAPDRIVARVTTGRGTPAISNFEASFSA